MNKKISIYELLGLIKDDKAPKKIKCDSYILDFVEGETNWRLSYIDGYNDYLFRDYHLRLDDEIEILEEVEDKEYEDIEELEVALLGQCDNWLRCPTNEATKQDVELNPYIISNVRENTLEFQHKINALIRNQKKILERLDK